MTGLRIEVKGIVQGVGFRPFIYNLAMTLQLTGWVRNTSSGVEIEINGTQNALDDFLDSLRHHAPPLSRIDSFEVTPCSLNGSTKFTILASQAKAGEFMPISPDVSICKDCQRELFDSLDRRYRYPFINCTNCGPRFTIIKDTPYDRPNTTMSGFPLCSNCYEEYENPLDRRFHAQPVACPECGPHIWFEVDGNNLAQDENALQMARQWLREGKIIAIKGLGGFHLACDACNTTAVSELRNRKRRSEKPFALMMYDLPTLRKFCDVSEAEESVLTDKTHPIVLLQKFSGTSISSDVAPHQQTLGVMLPYTPLHLLLIEPEDGFPEVLVMTSANLSEEPIAYRDDDARNRLADLADGFLLHNRPIHMRVDDSVIRVIDQLPYISRRARGFAPDPIHLMRSYPEILATGAELKNTFCLTRNQYAFVSHHIGDLENYETLQSFEEGISHYERLFRIKPAFLACDLHPNYLSTRYAQERAANEQLPLIIIQHHEAHIAACLTDNQWNGDEPVIGFSFDGTGYGIDGAIWGGEVFVGGYTHFERAFHLKYAPLAGGDASIRKPARMALSHLWSMGISWDHDLSPVNYLTSEEKTVLLNQLNNGVNTHPTSSMGRLFDAVSSLIGIRQQVTYEGQAAIEMEAIADPTENRYYSFGYTEDMITSDDVFADIITDLKNDIPAATISAKFHNGVARLVGEISSAIYKNTGIKTIALSGGVWQNKYLLIHTLTELNRLGFHALTHRQVPTNDGGIALGQAAIAAYQIMK